MFPKSSLRIVHRWRNRLGESSWIFCPAQSPNIRESDFRADSCALADSVIKPDRHGTLVHKAPARRKQAGLHAGTGSMARVESPKDRTTGVCAFPYAEFAHHDPGMEKIARNLLASASVVTARICRTKNCPRSNGVLLPAKVRLRPGPLLAASWQTQPTFRRRGLRESGDTVSPGTP